MIPNHTQGTIRVKRGDTLVLGWQALDAQGQPVPLTGVTVSATVRSPAARLVAQLDVEFVDQAAGSFETWAPGNGLTTDWPVGDLQLELQYTQTMPSGRLLTRSSETQALQMVADGVGA